jgi:flavodoxin
MNIAIVIHTNSGHTLKFAQAIREKLVALGHEVDLTGLRILGTVAPGLNLLPGTGGRFSIKSPPDVSGFDIVLVGGPVWMFKASPVIMRFLAEDLPVLKGKKALSFVTMGIKGGVRALRMMNVELEASGADVLEGEVLRYFMKVNESQMTAAVERICERITS